MRAGRKTAVCLAVVATGCILCGCERVQNTVSEAFDENAYELAESKRIERMETECTKLTAQYPDEDGWVEAVGPGDIPFLADPDYITKCTKLD